MLLQHQTPTIRDIKEDLKALVEIGHSGLDEYENIWLYVSYHEPASDTEMDEEFHYRGLKIVGVYTGQPLKLSDPDVFVVSYDELVESMWD